MTNPYAALRQAREVIADSCDGQKKHADLHYHLAQQPTLAAQVHAATYERAAENVKRMESALFSIDAALTGEGAAGDVILPTVAPAIEPNVAMECLLETMRDNPGAISVYAAVGAVKWALETITTLRDAALSAIRTPAVVRPEDVSDDTVREGFIYLRYNTSGCPITDNSRFDVSVRVADIRHLIAWAMTRRTPVSDALVNTLTDIARDGGFSIQETRQKMRAALEAAGRV